ncbi:MAG TPA: dTDP-glucose 4,6-dehydratase [Fimbriimonadaceae bacterium]|nr:dTDP-glucose 4,6-dehydratase [Fimbriimonadaceae bacterium]HRJ32871.1 dTDP-glucose 4,6-dehydratase [Fimbriimonadaceae bacterium]
MRLLVTGGAGFIGSHFARKALAESVDHLVVLDALTYAGNLSTMQDIRAQGTVWVQDRIENAEGVAHVLRDHRITHIVNFAAETHNDQSLFNPLAFATTNVVGVQNLLLQARLQGVERIVHISTDEVYGSIAEGSFTEESPLEPNTPYSASKAGGDLVCRAEWKAFQTPVLVTRGGNNYGPYQYPEKLIPFFISRLIDGKKVPLYGDGSQVREWIHVGDHVDGIWTVLARGKPGEAYNIGDHNEQENRVVVQQILQLLGRDESLVKSIPDPRKGAHDARYRMSCEKIQALGWSPIRPFAEELARTVAWYVDNPGWWREIVARERYQDFVRRFYGPSLGDDL